MSGLDSRKRYLDNADLDATQRPFPFTDPREPRVLPVSGFPFWTLNTIEPGHGMRQRVYHLDEMEFVLAHIANDRDTYVSQALFDKPCRRAIHVKWLTHAYLDLDIYKLPVPPNPGVAGSEIRTFCRNGGLPEPSVIVSSGRGIYLKWMWSSPLPRAAAGRAVAVNKALVRRFREWGADPAAVDVSRVLRLVGTQNTKSGEFARILYQADRSGKPLTYDFDTFADEILCYNLEQIRQFRADAKSKAELRILDHERARRAAHENAKARNGKAFCKEDWHWGVLEDLRTLAGVRYEDGVVPEGSRDLFGHIGACQLARVIPSGQLWPEIQEWSRILLPAGYRKSAEFRSHCSTLLDNAKRAASGELDTWNGRKVTPVYTYRASTLIDRLQITGTEMAQLTRLIDAGEKRRRDRESWRANHTGLSREEYLAQNTKSANKPWELEGISRCHWYRNQKQKNQ